MDLSPHLKAKPFCLLRAEQQPRQLGQKAARYFGGHQLSTSVKDRKQPFLARPWCHEVQCRRGSISSPDPLNPWHCWGAALLCRLCRGAAVTQGLLLLSVSLWEGDGERKAGKNPSGFPVSCYSTTCQECEIEVDSEYISRAQMEQ